MWTLLNYRIWLALLLSLALLGSHWKAYTIGGAVVTSAWDAARLEQAKDLAKFSEAARSKEQEIQANTRKVINDYYHQKKVHAAAAGAAADSLRDLTAELANATAASEPATTARRANGVTGLERELLSDCAKNLTGLAGEADRLEGQIIGLQQYIRAIGAAK